MSYSYEDVLSHEGMQLVGGVFIKRVGSKNVEVGAVDQNSGVLNLTADGVAIMDGTYGDDMVVLVEDVAAPAAPAKAKGGKSAKSAAAPAPVADGDLEFQE